MFNLSFHTRFICPNFNFECMQSLQEQHSDKNAYPFGFIWAQVAVEMSFGEIGTWLLTITIASQTICEEEQKWSNR